MQKTHRPHHRPRSRHHVCHFLNLLPIAQRVGHRLAFGDAADAALHDGDALFGFLRGAFPRQVVSDFHLGFSGRAGNL